MKLGKKPARPGAVKLMLRKYISLSQLPTPPSDYGQEAMVSAFGMLGNDNAGCCIFSGGAHETMIWGKEGGTDIAFTAQSVLSDYSAVTGYNPADPSTDQGGDMQVVAAYRQKTGLLDAAGNRHKIGAYLALSPGDVYQHMAASYVFTAIGIGVEFPGSAMDQFNAGQPWEIVPGATIDGGHYVPIVGRHSLCFNVITWGKTQPMDDDWFNRFNDESLVYLSPEMLTGGVSVNGFDLGQLQADLAQLQGA
jgi:hypothetical protein